MSCGCPPNDLPNCCDSTTVPETTTTTLCPNYEYCEEAVEDSCVEVKIANAICYGLPETMRMSDVIITMFRELGCPDGSPLFPTTTTSTTSTTTTTTLAPTTSTTSTSTTTTQEPCVCQTYLMRNIKPSIQTFQYVDCSGAVRTQPVGANSNITVCVCSDRLFYDNTAFLASVVGSGCISTTTSTTLAPTTTTSTSTTTTSTTTVAPTTTTSTSTTTTTQAPCKNIGDVYGGGKVFKVVGNLIYIAALSDATASTWGCNNINVPGANGTAIGTGEQNTTDIINGCGELGIAARVARNYTDGAYNDWFLPSLLELQELYTQRLVVGGFSSTSYWSSSEGDATTAWSVSFITGNPAGGAKVQSLRVRPIRVMTCTEPTSTTSTTTTSTTTVPPTTTTTSTTTSTTTTTTVPPTTTTTLAQFVGGIDIDTDTQACATPDMPSVTITGAVSVNSAGAVTITISSNLGTFDSLVGNNGFFWLSQNIGGTMYVRYYQRNGTTFTATAVDVAYLCPGATTTTTTTTTLLGCLECGATVGGSYAGTDSITQTKCINLVGTTNGSVITINYNAVDRPNRFNIYEVGGSLVATSGWVGSTSSTPGPWNPPGPGTGSFTFTYDNTKSYELRVDVAADTISDSWMVDMYCGAPATTTTTTTTTSTTTAAPGGGGGTTTTTVGVGSNMIYTYARCSDGFNFNIIVANPLNIGSVYKYNNGNCGTIVAYLGLTGAAPDTPTPTLMSGCDDPACPQL